MPAALGPASEAPLAEEEVVQPPVPSSPSPSVPAFRALVRRLGVPQLPAHDRARMRPSKQVDSLDSPEPNNDALLRP